MTAPAVAEHIAVVAVRHDRRRILYSHCADRAAAESTIKALAKIGLEAEIVVGVDPLLRPGSAMKPSKAPA